MNSQRHLLLRYLSDGDAEAFAALVREHGGMVLATARRITGDAALAEDVAQETFLELARSAQGNVESVAAWLHRVAWRKACNALRGESRRRRHEVRAAAEDETQAGATEPAWEELEPQIDAALNDLPEEVRELLVAHYLESCTQQELASRLGVNQSTVSRQLESAVRELRKLLRGRGVLCGSGLAMVLSAQKAEAVLPAKLGSSLGKLALSGAGSSGAAAPATTFTTTTILAMTTTTKILIATATAAAALSVPLVLHDDVERPSATPRRTSVQPLPVAGKVQASAATATVVPHYRPAMVSPQVQQKVEGIVRRHAGMSKEQLSKSVELNKLMERFIAAMEAPEFEEQILKRISALPPTGHNGMVKMDFEMLDDAKGRAWLEAAVADDAELMRDWVLNTLDGAIFEFAFDPNLERSSNGVSLHPGNLPAQTQPAAAPDRPDE
ncbi:RNA polymerase sigma factor [Prosthecobacter sp.]|uniref:RNA polymerase sigma factor n=1 Tax=Prosthecobacter sp. TaxID=1965333 RepID=UPI0037839950